jgi:hypothetical protein
VNSIVHIAHTTIQFPQNNDTFLCRFSYLVKSPKNASIFCGFLCNMEKLQSCNSCYKRFTEKSQSCNRAGEKDRSLSHNSIHTYISIYIHIKELQKELRQGAASELRLDINWSCILELRCRCGSYKSLDFKNSIFFLFNKKSYF